MKYVAAALATAIATLTPFGTTAIAAPGMASSTTTTAGPPLVVLAGGVSWLVFEQRDPEQTAFDSPKVMVRSTTGEVTTLPHSAGEWSWHVSGDMVVAEEQPFINSPLDWWDMDTGKHGIVKFHESEKAPGKRLPLGATQDGVAYLSHTHHVHLIHVESRKHKRSAFMGVKHKIAYAFTTPRGIVYETQNGRDWYQKLSGKHRINRIHVPNSSAYGSACYSSNAHYLACWRAYDEDDDLTTQVVELIPLDGAAPTLSTDCAGEPTLTHDTVVWSTGNTYNGHDGCASAPPTLNLLTAGQTDVHHSAIAVNGPTPRTYDTATAYGLAIFTTPAKDTIIGVDSTGTAQTLYTSQPPSS